MPEQTGKLQVLPQGLLGFLQLKNGGKNPAELSSTLSAEVELLDWYFASQAEVITSGSEVVAGVGFTGYPDVTVPSNQYWAVLDMNVRSDILGAGDTLDFNAAMGLISPGGALVPIVASVGSGTRTVGQVASSAFGRRLIVPPSTAFGLWTNIFAGANNIVIDMRVARLPL